MRAVIILAVALTAYGQTIPNAVLAPIPMRTFVDSAGRPLAGGTICSYVAGTTSGGPTACPDGTPLATYTDNTATVPNSNPIVLDSAGRARIWIGAGPYKFVLKNLYGVTVWTEDNVMEPSFNFLKAVQSVGDSALLTYVAPGGGVSESVWSKANQSLSVLDFGAVCNGSTDDTAAIQAAMTEAATIGSELTVPGKTCLTGKLTMPNGLILRGFGGTLKAKKALDDSVLYGTGLTSLTISGRLTIDGNKANQTCGAQAPGLYLLNCTGAMVSGLSVKDTMSHGVWNYGGSRNRFRDITVTSSGDACIPQALITQRGSGFLLESTTLNQADGLSVDGSAHMNVNLITATYNNLTNVLSTNAVGWCDGGTGPTHCTGGQGVQLRDGSTYNSIVGTIGSGNLEASMYLAADPNTNWYNSIVSLVGTTSPHALELLASHNAVSNVVAVGNTIWVTAGGAGVYVGGSHNTLSNIFTALNEGDGIRIDGSPGSYGIGDVLNGVVSINNSQGSAGTYSGVRFLGSTYTTLGEVRASDDQGSKTQGWGVASTSPASGNQVVNAALDGNLTAPYSVQPTDVMLTQSVAGDQKWEGNTLTMASATVGTAALLVTGATPAAVFTNGIRLDDSSTTVDAVADGGFEIRTTATPPVVLARFKRDLTASGIGPGNATPAGTLMIYDATATTGSTVAVVKAGAGQSTNSLFVVQDSAGTTMYAVDSTGTPVAVPLKSTTGTRFICVDTNGKFVSSAVACSGT